MRILLDENLDRRLRAALSTHDVFTVGYKGWSGIKNGKLLKAAEQDGFDVLLTGDQSIYYEQNLAGRQLAILAMSSVEWQIVKNYLPQIIAALEKVVPGSFQTVDCGTFSRKPPHKS